MANIYICDDEDGILKYLKKLLKGHHVETFINGYRLLERLEQTSAEEVDLVLQDLRMPELDGIQVLQELKQLRPTLPVVIMTAFATVDDAVQAIKLGAYDYLTKPFPNEKLLGMVENVLEFHRSVVENQISSGKNIISMPEPIIFNSPRFRSVYDLTLKVADSHANILILGESGTGKELIASALHHNSHRRDHAFISINCAALSDTLLESQLFGHIRGAFTGAISNHKGLLEEADGGTLFLDEIGDVSPAVQAKLLRVTQERDFIPVGASRPKKVDVRFVAATNKDLQQEVAKGNFREDLYYRLNVISINLPPLRDRQEDIEPLAYHFLHRCADKMGKRIRNISDDVMKMLQLYKWPGNVRELENVIERAAIMSGSDTISADVIQLGKNHFSSSAPIIKTVKAVALEDVERQHIESVLKENRYNKSRTAELLGISRRTLDRRIAEFGLMDNEI